MKTFQLGPHTLLFDDDFDTDRIASFRWLVRQGGSVQRSFFFRGGNIGINIAWEVIGIPPIGLEVDHINHNIFDNQRSNLRFCTGRQNRRNRRSHNRTGFKGVAYQSNRKKPWCASIKLDGAHKWLGSYATAQEASLAYQAAARVYHGEFACFEMFPVGL